MVKGCCTLFLLISRVEDLIRYNSVFNLYKDDYPNLVRAEQDVRVPKKIIYTQYQSFMDLKNCKGKVISAAAWHPMRTGKSSH